MRYLPISIFISLLGLNLFSACTSVSPTTPLTPTATLAPTPTATLLAPQEIDFTTPDGATIVGRLYGSGDAVVIFSVMGNCKRGWEDMAELVAKNDMMALTYQWRGCKGPGYVNDVELQKFVDDLRGAIQYMRDQGVSKIVLAGASLGGVASAKLAVETGPNGLIIVAAPREIEDWGFEVETGDVNIDMPKLFITAEDDTVVALERSRELFDLAAEPKQWHTFPGTAHGTDLFETGSKEELQQLILDFISSIGSLK